LFGQGGVRGSSGDHDWRVFATILMNIGGYEGVYRDGNGERGYLLLFLLFLAGVFNVPTF